MAKSRKTASYEVLPSGIEVTLSGTTIRVSSYGVEQSFVDLSRPTRIEFEYLQHMDLVMDAFLPSWASPPPRVLHAGAGACALSLAWQSKHPRLSQVAVEIDADLAQRVTEELDLRRKPRLKLRVGDAYDVLAGSKSTYTMIVRDAFDGPITPQRVTGRAWMELVRMRLRDGGAYMANIGRDSDMLAKQDVAATLEAFPSMIVIADPKVWKGDRNGNLVAVGWDRTAPDLEEIERSVRRLPLPTRVYYRDDISKWLGGIQPTR